MSEIRTYPKTANEARTSVGAVLRTLETSGKTSRTQKPNPRPAGIGIGSREKGGSTAVPRWLALCVGAAFASWCLGCAGPPQREVVVMGMIHGGHQTSERYGIDTVKRYVRAIKPNFILCEIPPDRLKAALTEFRQTGAVTESRVRRFPEYVQAIFPLIEEMDFVIVPCAGWTQEMSDDRRAKLELWETTRPEASQEVDRAEQAAEQEIEDRGLGADPLGIHTDAYDEIVKRGLEPYNRLFNDDLGAGGWDHINAAHYALIEAALDTHQGAGQRFLITFGSWHKYWFLEKLEKRRDIVLRRPQDYLGG